MSTSLASSRVVAFYFQCNVGRAKAPTVAHQRGARRPGVLRSRCKWRRLAVFNVPATMSIRERLFPVPRGVQPAGSNPARSGVAGTTLCVWASVKPRDVNYFYDCVRPATRDSALVTPRDAYALHPGTREGRVAFLLYRFQRAFPRYSVFRTLVYRYI